MSLPIELGELLDREAPPGIRFLRAWLLPLGGAGATRDAGDPLPYTLIQRYAGHEDVHTDHGFYQLDHLAEAADGATAFTACEDYARLCSRRILYLRDHPWTEVTVPGWGVVTADLVKCVESAHWEPYGDSEITRMTARFAVDLRLVTA